MMLPRSAHRCVLSVWLAGLLWLAGVGSAGVSQADEVKQLSERGRTIAETRCAQCHAVGADGSSPHEDAPPFRTFKELWPIESIAEALGEGLVAGHPDMPEIVMTPEDIDAFLTYLNLL